MDKLLDIYLNKIDEISSFDFNKDQKEMCKEILRNVKDEKNLQNVFQFLAQRVKTGFKFDIAPTTDSQSVAVLKYDKERSFIGNLKSCENENTLIIGENYDALKNLIVIERERQKLGIEYNYDVIYIDPPYNTEYAKSDGNTVADDKENKKATKFIYRDKFSRNGWLNMMNERLRMAKKLLKDDGVIFVSIDDTEQAYLKILMDEIFGEENFITNFIWQKKNSGSAADSQFIKNLTEYIICFAKNKNLIEFNEFENDLENYKYTDKYVKNRGKYNTIQLDFASMGWTKTLDYEFEYEGIKYYPGGNKEKWMNRQNGNHAKADWTWRWNKEKLEWGIKNGFVVFKNNKIYTKQYQYVNNNNENIVRKSKFNNLILNMNGSVGTNELRNIFSGYKVFDHPKPSLLIKWLTNLNNNKSARVLDFFAGSGTTGHAVMELNKEDDGDRTFTLITNNENNIGYDVTYERLYRINKGLGTKHEEFPWAQKNAPYNNSLNVFSIEKFNTSIDNVEDNNTKIKQILLESFSHFDINYLNNKELNKNLLNALLSLEPLEIKEEKEEENETN